MKNAFYLFLLVLTAGCGNGRTPSEQPLPDATFPMHQWDRDLLDRTWKRMDTILLNDGPRHPLPDSIYCFYIHEGWGNYYYTGLVYPDGTGYVAKSTQTLSLMSGDFYQDETSGRRLNREQWQELRNTFQASGFWQAEPLRGGCLDCTDYYLWAKEGSRIRLQHWSSFSEMNDTIRSAALKIQSVCGYLEAEGMVTYMQTKDSIIFSARGLALDALLDAELYLEYLGRLRPLSDKVAFPFPGNKKPYASELYLVYVRRDGSFRKTRILKLEKEPR